MSLGENGAENNFENADLRGRDFSWANLSNGKFSGADLSNADLTGANLTGAKLTPHYHDWGYRASTSTKLNNADLSFANLSNSNLHYADFSNAHLIGSTLKNADIQSANFKKADLSYADFTNSNLWDSLLENVTANNAKFNYIKGASYLNDSKFQNSQFIEANLRDSTLDRSDFSNSDLRAADFYNASLKNTIFDNADLSYTDISRKLTNFNDANLSNASFIGANLDEAYLQNATIDNVNFTNARLSGANFNNSSLQRSNFTNLKGYNKDENAGVGFENAKLRYSNFDSADIRNSSFISSDLMMSNFDRSDINRAEFRNSNLGFASLKETKGFSVNFENSFLRNASLESANLIASSFKGVNLTNTEFKNSDVSQSDFNNAVLKTTSFNGADLNSSDFSKSIIDNPTFKNANLTGVLMDGQNLANIDFTNASFNGTYLNNTNLNNADFSNAKLNYSFLHNANAKEAKFNNAELIQSDFKNTNLNNADFSNAKLTQELKNIYGTQFFGSSFEGASLINSDFKNADLRGVNFRNANLSGSDFTGAKLNEANFKNSVLQNLTGFIHPGEIPINYKPFQNGILDLGSFENNTKIKLNKNQLLSNVVDLENDQLELRNVRVTSNNGSISAEWENQELQYYLKPNSINNGVFNIEYDIWDKWDKVRHPEDIWFWKDRNNYAAGKAKLNLQDVINPVSSGEKIKIFRNIGNGEFLIREEDLLKGFENPNELKITSLKANFDSYIDPKFGLLSNLNYSIPIDYSRGNDVRAISKYSDKNWLWKTPSNFMVRIQNPDPRNNNGWYQSNPIDIDKFKGELQLEYTVTGKNGGFLKNYASLIIDEEKELKKYPEYFNRNKTLEYSEKEINQNNLLKLFKIDTNEDDYISNLKSRKTSLFSNKNKNKFILDTSQKDNLAILDVKNSIVDSNQKNKIFKALESENIGENFDLEKLDLPYGTFDFSIKTNSNEGFSIVQLYLEDGEKNKIDKLVKTTNITKENPKGTPYLFNSQVINYDSKANSNFESWLNSLKYKLYYYEEPLDSGNKGNLENISLSKSDSLLSKFVEADIKNIGHINNIDGSAFLIDKDGDGDIDLISALLLDQGFFDLDLRSGIIRDPLIPANTSFDPNSANQNFNFNYTNTALSYKYEIYNAADPTEKISGLLGYDYNDTDSSGIAFDSNTSTGGAADYNIKFFVKVEDSNAGSGAAINLETLDVTFDLADGSGSTFFNDFSGATVDTSGTVFNTAISGAIDASGSGVRFTGAVSDELTDASGVTNDGNYHSLFELKGVTIDESVGEYLDKITFTDNTNIYDTVLSRRGGAQTAAIKSISELTGSSTTQGFDIVDKYNDVSVHEAQSNLTNLATNIYTQRYIGSSEKTNLIRANDVVSNVNNGLISESFWVNTGTFSEDLANIVISDASGSAFNVIDKTLDISGGATSFDGWDLSLSKNGATLTNIEGLDVSQSDISGSSLDASTIEGAKLWTKLSFDASGVTAGTDYSASSQAFQLTGQQSSSTSGFADKLSTNLITFQGDLNYDGRVSLNDLAFLNAGKVAADASGNFSDVDADFDGDIDVADLAVLSADWGETLDYSGSTNADFSGTTWTTLDASGITTEINTLEDFSGVTVSDASGDTLSDADIFSDADLQLAYENSSYTNAKSVYSSFDSVGTGLTETNSPYDTLSL